MAQQRSDDRTEKNSRGDAAAQSNTPPQTSPSPGPTAQGETSPSGKPEASSDAAVTNTSSRGASVPAAKPVQQALYLSVLNAQFLRGRANTRRMRLFKAVPGVRLFACKIDLDVEVALIGRMLLIAHRCDTHSHGMRYDEQDAVSGEAVTIGYINHCRHGQIKPLFWTHRPFAAGPPLRLLAEIQTWWTMLHHARRAELWQSFDDNPSGDWQRPWGGRRANAGPQPDLYDYASQHGLKLVVRGAQYGRLEMGGKKIVHFRGPDPDWQSRMRIWLDGWGRSQEEHRPVKFSGTVAVAGRTVEYSWIAPARSATSPRTRNLDLQARSAVNLAHLFNPVKTHGETYILDPHGGLEVDIHGRWGFAEEESIEIPRRPPQGSPGQ
jgi:hypothetical protein